jgi:hypothetical protein
MGDADEAAKAFATCLEEGYDIGHFYMDEDIARTLETPGMAKLRERYPDPLK